jgi:hypothetical protein
MPIVRPFPHWVSLGGVALQVPAEWSDTTEYCFAIDGDRKRRLVWGEEPWDEAGAVASLQERHTTLLGIAEAPQDVSPVVVLPHDQLRIWGFSVRFGDEVQQVNLCAFAAVHPQGALTLQSRTTPADTALLPGALASLAPWGIGQRLPHGRYGVLGSSFAWPTPLSVPTRFVFLADDGSAQVRAMWGRDKPDFTEPDWGTAFAIEVGNAVRLVSRDVRPVQGGQRPAPFMAAHSKLILHDLRWVAHSHGPAPAQVLNVFQAFAQHGAGYLTLELRSELPHLEAVAIWSHVLESLTLEP